MQDVSSGTRPTSPGAAPAAFLSACILISAGCGTSAESARSEAGSEGAQRPGEVVFPATNRPDVRGIRGAVSAGHPLAAAAGHDVLRRGGNAMDAAIAMAGVLAVVRPHMNGVGGDAFALYYEAATGRVHAMNGSGRAGALATPALFAERGLEEMPGTGPLSVSVPGAVAAWVDALERFGTVSREELLAPAIGYARDGFPVSTRLASDIAAASRSLNDHARALYTPGGEPPPVGGRLRNPELAATLERDRERRQGRLLPRLCSRAAGLVPRSGGRVRAGFRPRRSHHHLGGAAERRFRGLHHARDAAQHPGHRAASALRDGQVVRPAGDGAQQRRLSAHAHRDEEARLRGQGSVGRGSRVHGPPPRRAARPRVPGGPGSDGGRGRRSRVPPVRSACGHGGGRLRRLAGVGPPGGQRCGRWNRIRPGRFRRHRLPDRSRPVGQRGELDPEPVRRVRLGAARAGNGNRSPQPRRALQPRARTPQHRRARQAALPHAHPD